MVALIEHSAVSNQPRQNCQRIQIGKKQLALSNWQLAKQNLGKPAQNATSVGPCTFLPGKSREPLARFGLS
jgi:hypothetical protein